MYINYIDVLMYNYKPKLVLDINWTSSWLVNADTSNIGMGLRRLQTWIVMQYV